MRSTKIKQYYKIANGIMYVFNLTPPQSIKFKIGLAKFKWSAKK